jgi:hypothetical protein
MLFTFLINNDLNVAKLLGSHVNFLFCDWESVTNSKVHYQSNIS